MVKLYGHLKVNDSVNPKQFEIAQSTKIKKREKIATIRNYMAKK